MRHPNALSRIGGSRRCGWLRSALVTVLASLSFLGSARTQSARPAEATPSLNYRGNPGGRASMAGWQAFASQKTSEAKPGAFRVGAASVQFTTGFEVAYNTNVTSSGTDPIPDISVAPRFSIGINWPITRQNELQIQLGVQYRKYLLHPDLDQNSFIIDPGTVIEYRIFSGDFVFTIYDSPSISTDPGDDPGITNTINFQQLQNTVGFSILHDLNKLTTTIGFERSDVRSLSGTFESNDGTTYRIYGSSFYSITPTTRIGLRGVVSKTDYTQNTLNDYTSALAGVVFSSHITPLTSYYLEAGIQSATYSDSGTPESDLTFVQQDGFNEDVSGTLGGGDYVLPYFEIGLASQLNQHVQHSIIFSREAQPSNVSNYTENNSVEYQLSWKMNRLATLNLGTAYTAGTISSATTPIDYWRWQSTAGISLEIARDTSLAIFYDYLVNDMAETNGSYDRSRFGMSIGWTF